MKKVGLYVRVSTEEQKQHGLSVDSQLVALQQWAKENDYEVVNIYNDAGLSASASYKKRKALLDMIKDCQNKKIDLVAFTKLDRFFRSTPDYYACVEQMNGVPWKAIWEDYETETSSGVFKVNIMLAIAQAESQRTSERIKAVNEYRRAKGDFVGGVAPLGYRVQKSSLLIDENNQEGVKAFFNEYLKTTSTAKAIYKAQEYGLTISRQRASRILSSSVYYGDANGYKCEPYITKEQFNYIQELRKVRQRNPQTVKRVYLFSGLIKCEKCGGAMTTHCNVCKSRGRKYIYKTYKCSRRQSFSGCHSSKKIFESTLEKFLLNEIENIIDQYQITAVSYTTQNADNEKQIKKLNAKLDRIGIRFEDGDISADEYRAKRDEIKDEIRKLEASKSPTISRLPDNWKSIYSELDDEHKRAFWKKLIYKINYVEKENTFNVTLR